MAEPARHPRDSQRSRVYRAESPISPSPLPGLQACAAFIDRVVGSLWWAQRFPDHAHDCVPRLRPGNGARQAFFRPGDPRYDGGDPTITLPRRYRTKGVVLHELTHWALWDEPLVAHHGSTFARLHLDLTEEFLGAPRAAQLEAGYVAERVRIGRAPRAAPDGRLRYGWDERLRLGRSRRLAIRYTTESGTDLTTGVLVGLTPGGRRIRLLDPCGAAEVATDAVFAIDLAASK